METTAGGQQPGFIVQQQTNFSAHPESSCARIYKRTARAARNTRYRYNQISPLDHKMADSCVSLARTNTVSSTITKPIKTWKTSNKSSYNFLRCLHMAFHSETNWRSCSHRRREWSCSEACAVPQLPSTFHFIIPDDPSKFFSQSGWCSLNHTS